MKRIVILIHGYLTDYHDFNNLEKTLINYYDYVVLLELPGHGAFHNKKDFQVKNSLTYVEKEISFYLKLGTVDLIGYSLGGAIVNYLCKKYHNINQAIQLAPPVKYLNFVLPFKRLAYRFLYHSKNDKILLKANDQITRHLTKVSFLKEIRLNNFLVFRKLIKTLNKEKHQNQVSTLFIYGRLDELVPLKSVKTSFKNCENNNKKLIIYEGIGHVLLRGPKNNEIVYEIKKFLKLGERYE